MDAVETLIQKLFFFNKFISGLVHIFTYSLDHKTIKWSQWHHDNIPNIKTFTGMKPIYRFTSKKTLLQKLLSQPKIG